MNKSNKKETLTKLYRAIRTDTSIQRYSLGYKGILQSIEKEYKHITYSYQSFSTSYLLNAIEVTEGKFKEDLENFARELKINIKTLREK